MHKHAVSTMQMLTKSEPENVISPRYLRASKGAVSEETQRLVRRDWGACELQESANPASKSLAVTAQHVTTNTYF